MGEALKMRSISRRPREPFTDQVSTYYLELERLLDRVDCAQDHYQALGVERSANTETIQRAYRQAVTLLHPSKCGINIHLPEGIEEKTKRAFERLSLAFSVLGNFGKRIEYDNSFRRKTTQPLPVRDPESYKRSDPAPLDLPPTTMQQPVEEEAAPAQAPEAVSGGKLTTVAAQDPDISRLLSHDQKVHVGTTSEEPRQDHRRCPRFRLSVPVRIFGYNKHGDKWQDMAETINVGRFGVAMRMHKRVRRGTVLHLSLPLPAKLRSYGYSDPSFSVWAIVRRVEPLCDGIREVGVEFIGERPPAGFLQSPGRIYRNRNWDGAERRRETRQAVNERVKLEFLDEDSKVIATEQGTVENVSPSGARVRLKCAPDELDTVMVTNYTGSFKSLASVRDWFAGKDGFERLCVNFLEEKWPV
jgi:hypothetical protein